MEAWKTTYIFAIQELEENRSERSQKYRELRKREETMDHFLSTFEDAKKEELNRLETLENNNVALLEKLSRHLAHFKQLPRYCLSFCSTYLSKH